MTMRVKLPNAFRFGLTGTPIDRTMVNTHRDFGPVVDGQQERYLSYYGIKRAIKDGATLEVHYLRDRVPFAVDEKPLNVGFEKMCDEMEVEDEEAKDLIQRQRSQWKELARHPDRVEWSSARCWSTSSPIPTPTASRRNWWAWIAPPARASRTHWTPSSRSGPAAGMVRRHHLRRAERRPGSGALPLRQAETGRADRLFQADAEGVGGSGTGRRSATTAASGGRR